MIGPEEFREIWRDEVDPLVTFPPETTADATIPDVAKQFLNRAGLPESAAPFLDFAAPDDDSLPRVSDQWGLGADYSRFRVIGSNGSGDPICIDESSPGHVVSLNHDNHFAAEFINSSVPQLAESLLAYRRLVKITMERNGQDAFLDGNIPVDVVEQCRSELRRIDPAALEEGAFWHSEFCNLPA